MTTMTEPQARELAKQDRNWRAKKTKAGWVVWSDAADHVVEFDNLPDL
jgi:hypothetical protein